MSLAEQSERRAPLRPVKLGQWTARVNRAANGTLYMSVAEPLDPYPATWLDRLQHWAGAAPDRVFLAQRGADGAWQSLTYARVLHEVRRIGAALLTHGLSAERPIAILSGNSIEHALLALGAMYAGIPYAPISPAYSLMSGDFGKLRAIVSLITPGLVFAGDGATFSRAIEAAASADAELVVVRNPPHGGKATLFSAQGRRPRRHRQVPVHVGIDRHAERRHQHASHADLEPGDARRRLRLRERRAPGRGRLAALESHLRQQP
jgi:feruloyl-CoA synthase